MLRFLASKMLQTGSLPMSDLLAASCTSAACRMSSLPSLDHVVQSEGECSQQLPPEYKLESPLESPQLCAAPKRKLSVHRRGNRRIWYHLKRKTEVAKCVHCGISSAGKSLFTGITGNENCTGQCVKPFQREYNSEYNPPC